MLVLTYHSISPGPAPLCVTALRLAEQLDALAALGWRGIALSELEARITGPEAPSAESERLFAITFDDGYRDFLEAALPVLETRGLPATLFALPPIDATRAGAADAAQVPGGTDAPILSREELRSVAGRGVEIGAHGVSHCDLTRLDAAALDRELEQARRTLEDASAARVERLAYPFGRFDHRVREAAGRRFRTAFTTQLAPVARGVDPLAIPRVDAFYLDSPGLRRALADGRPERWLTPRRWLRRLRGSEPRRPLPRRPYLLSHSQSNTARQNRSARAHVRG
jgi:peptidoglycan/xylan/chitin deacetylase (PgdA/CDA1 family)